MDEADLRLHLAAQGLPELGAIHYPAYDDSDQAQDALLDGELARIAARSDLNIRPVLFDIAHTSHLAAVGRFIWEHALRQRLLAVGSSSVVQALTAHLAGPGEATALSVPGLKPAAGTVFVLSGSLSPVTARQVEAATAYERLPADVSRLMTQPDHVEQLVERITSGLRARRNVLVHTQASSGAAPDTTQARSVAQTTAALVVQVVNRMARVTPLRRVGIAGGDTSSHVVQALGLWGLSYQTTMAPGVTVSCAHSENPPLDGLELMLKGGQMGAVDLFNRLVNGD